MLISQHTTLQCIPYSGCDLLKKIGAERDQVGLFNQKRRAAERSAAKCGVFTGADVQLHPLAVSVSVGRLISLFSVQMEELEELEASLRCWRNGRLQDVRRNLAHNWTLAKRRLRPLSRTDDDLSQQQQEREPSIGRAHGN